MHCLVQELDTLGAADGHIAIHHVPTFSICGIAIGRGAAHDGCAHATLLVAVGINV